MFNLVRKSYRAWAVTLRSLGTTTTYGLLTLAIPLFGMLVFKDSGKESVEKSFKKLTIQYFKKSKNLDISGTRYPKELEVATFCKKWDGKSENIDVIWDNTIFPIPTVLCAHYKKAQYFDAIVYKLSFFTFIFTLILLITIITLGLLAYRSREALFRFFKPALYLSQAATILLLIANCAIIMLSFYGSEIEGLGIIIIMGIFAFFSIALVAYQSLKPVAIQPDYWGGKILTKESQPKLWHYIEKIAAELGTPPPDTIIVGLKPTFFVTEAPLIIVDLTTETLVEGKNLYLSLPYCTLLSQEELSAIIGHELGHFMGEDTLWSHKFYPIYVHAANTIQSIRSLYSKIPRLLYIITLMVFMPSYIVMKFFLNIFESAEKKISRERELHADSIGAGITSKEACATALAKIYRYDMIFDLMERNLVQACVNAQIPANIVTWFTHACKELVDTPELKASLNKEQLKHPRDTHPPLLDRLHALHIKLDTVYEQSHTIPSHPSASLFVEREKLEEELTTIEAQKVIYQLATAVRN